VRVGMGHQFMAFVVAADKTYRVVPFWCTKKACGVGPNKPNSIERHRVTPRLWRQPLENVRKASQVALNVPLAGAVWSANLQERTAPDWAAKVDDALETIEC